MVTKVGGTVTFCGVKKQSKSVVIPATVTAADGITYKVTKIADGACLASKKLRKISIGANVKQIGKNAFKKCGKLQQITLKNPNVTFGANAWKGIHDKVVLKLPKKTKQAAKLLKKMKKAGAKQIQVKKYT